MAGKSFIGKTSGLRPHMTLRLYKTVIRPQVTYASVVWWNKTQQITAINKLNSLQWLACLCISGDFTSTSTAALELLLDIAPLDLFIQLEARKHLYKLTASGESREELVKTGHFSALHPLASEPLMSMRSDVMAKDFLFTRPYTTNLGTRRDWEDVATVKKWTYNIVWYTDGSLINGKAGYGAYKFHPHCSLSCSLGKCYMVFQAEK